MIRPRPALALALAALIVAGCAAFEPSPSGPVAPSGSAPPAAAEPTDVALADFAGSVDGSIVRVVGLARIRSGSFMELDGHEPITLEDAADREVRITAWIPVSKEDPPAPNAMAELGNWYTAADLRLTTEDGTAILEGGVVALTGSVHNPADGSPHLDRVTRIEAAEPPSSGPTPAPGATATATPAPRAVTIADLEEAVEGETVRVIGLIRVPGSTRTASGYCSLDLQDSMMPDRRVTVSIPVGTGTPPPPNTMAPLEGFFYDASDLLLTADDGTAIHDGGGVALTGTLARTGDGPSLARVSRIEAASAPLPKPASVNFTTIKKQKAGTFVRITGRLDVPIITSCAATCGIYLEDRATGSSIRIEVVRGEKGGREPNTMWPLPANYRLGDLRVVANDGRVLKGGARVRVTGWIEVGSDKKRRIDPVVRIDYAP